MQREPSSQVPFDMLNRHRAICLGFELLTVNVRERTTRGIWKGPDRVGHERRDGAKEEKKGAREESRTERPRGHVAKRAWLYRKKQLGEGSEVQELETCVWGGVCRPG